MRNVLVTGGSSGIGRACVRRFARGGDRVWFTYLSGPGRAKDLTAELSAEGGDVTAFEFEQGNWESHCALVAALPGPVDVLVNNAAVGSATVDRYAAGDDHERAAAFLHVNSVGPLWLTRQLLPGMVARGAGTVVNVGSVGGGITVFPGFHVADGMSKAAIAYLTRHLAAELAREPVDVCAVCPGATDTRMMAETLAALGPDGRRTMCDRLPGGLIDPDEVAGVVHWLADGHARLLRGAVLDASRGVGVHPGLVTGGSA